jgi:cytoskeletal protein CcmA (bactofilin family)
VSSAISTIGKDLVITGNVASKGEIHLDGVIHGNVKRIALARRQFSTRGNVVAEEVVVRGLLVASVRALRVSLQSRAHVEANLTHQGLAVEQEALFDGKSARLRDGELLRQERRTQCC